MSISRSITHPSYLAAAALIVLTAAATPAQGIATSQTQPAKSWVISIGISRYPKLPGGQQIRFADRDATLFAETMRRVGVAPDRIKLLTGPEATLAAIKSAIGSWLARSAVESDFVYIFFSGHGYVEREFREAYLLAQDSDLGDPYGTALSLSELQHALATRIKSRRILLLADAVRRDLFNPEADSGTAAGLFVNSMDQLAYKRPGVSLFLASGPGEFSREGQRWGAQGVFARHLAAALTEGDGNGDKIISAEEAFAYVSQHVREETSNKQNPFRSQTDLTRFALARAGHEATLARAEAQGPAQKKEPAQIIAPPPATNASKSQTVAVPAGIPHPEREAVPTPAPAKRLAPVPPETPAVQAYGTVAATGAGEVAVRLRDTEIDAPPRPVTPLPQLASVASHPAGPPVEANTSLAVAPPAAAPSPLVLQFDAAIASGNLLGAKGTSAWEIYERMSEDRGSAADTARVRQALVEALTRAGVAIVAGDVRSDNLSEKVDEFRRAGQFFARAKSLAPSRAEIVSLEKLSAAQALLALQFYDEAERALNPLQESRMAEVENALGLVHHGRFDAYRAERAFKRAAELDAKWATPHYNLALLYRSQKKEAALSELEQAASLDASNVSILTALGDEYFSREQWESAARTYRKAVELKPSDETLHTKLGHALYSQGLREEANREYQKARDLRGKQP